jgi:hypothetical protein
MRSHVDHWQNLRQTGGRTHEAGIQALNPNGEFQNLLPENTSRTECAGKAASATVNRELLFAVAEIFHQI